MRLIIFLAGLAFVSGNFSPALCQGALEPTSVVAVGQKVTIRTSSGEPVRGRVTKVTKEGILVNAGKQGSLQVASSDIVQIRRKSRGIGALVGLGVGAGIGLAIGVSNTGDWTKAEAGGIAAGLYGGIGAAVGAAIGMDRTVYQKR